MGLHGELSMPKFNVEYKIAKVGPGYQQYTHTKKTMDNPVEVAAEVMEACSDGGALEFLTVRRESEKATVKTNPVKPVVK